MNVGEASVPRPLLSYKQALAWLYSLQRFGIKLGLENIQRLLDELSRSGGFQAAVGDLPPSVAAATYGVPREIAFPWKVIHVAGTNGKGSVCAMIDSICRAQGYRTGLFISPHLITFRERIRVNGEMISEDAVADGLTIIRDLVADWDPHPTFFEVTTALALKHFGDGKIDIAILETGLGGRLDATNAVQSDVSVITPIAFDHEELLGNTLAEIAGEKAGIIKPGVPVVSAPQQPQAEEVIRARAAECGSPVQFVNEPYHGSPVALRGEYQKQNAAVAIAAIQPRTSSSTKKRLCVDSRRSNGLLVFRNGTSAPSSTARIIPARRAFWPKRGAKFLVIRRRRSCSRFFPTKICAVSAKRSRRLPVR